MKPRINSKSCTTFTADVQNVRCLQRHKHRGAYATASLHVLSMTRWSRRSHSSVMCCCNSSTVPVDSLLEHAPYNSPTPICPMTFTADLNF